MKQYSPDVVALGKGMDEDDNTAEPSTKKIAILILDCNFIATRLPEVPIFKNPYHFKTINETQGYVHMISFWIQLFKFEK